MSEVSLPCGEVKSIPRPYEEKAYAYADKQAEIYRGLKEPSGGYANVVDAYIAGAKENGIQWHDLRKDPNDLPKGHLVVLNQVGAQTIYDPNRGFLVFEGVGIKAWCEVPLFKE